MCLNCTDFINRGAKILDLGCGPGIVAKVFQDYFQAEVMGVDIKDNRIFPIPFKIVDGQALPFLENSFDIVLINYVLHHTKDPISILKEAKRVSKKIIIIQEDLPEEILSKIFCKIHGLTYDRFFQHQKASLSFKSEKEWEKIFEKIGLNIIFKKRVSNLIKRELFILRTQ